MCGARRTYCGGPGSALGRAGAGLCTGAGGHAFDIPYGTPIVDGKLRRDRSERDLEAQDGAAAKAVPDAVTTL